MALAPGDKIQVAQQHAGKIFWIYASVISANKDGGALVQVTHRSNRDEGKQLIVSADQIRTKDDVEKILGKKDRTDFNRHFRERDGVEFARHHQVQIDRLS